MRRKQIHHASDPFLTLKGISFLNVVLKQLLTVILSLLVLSALGGCVHSLQNTPASKDGADRSSPSVSPDLSEEPNYLVDKDGRTLIQKRTASKPITVPGPSRAQSPAEVKKPPRPAPGAATAEPSEEGVRSVLDEALDFCEVSQDFWQKGELENALEALDQAYALILRVDTDNRPKLIREKEDLRFMISKRILEIYASRNIVVNGHHDAIPLDMNRHIEAEIKSFTAGNREKNFFVRSYRRSGQYRPYIVEALRKAGLPEELSWLPLIESGFKVNAMSRARALGLWQFISSTGYKFGLKRNTYIDERLDPVKSTQAAIAYLKELHQIFGDWTTVLAAYNCGEGRVLRVIRSQNVNYLDNFWDLYRRLPRETARYVPRFLATLHILKNPEKYGLDQVETLPPMPFETVPVARKLHLKDIAKAMGIEEKTLRALNPELRHGIVPGDDYALRVPPDAGQKLTAGLDNIPEYRKTFLSTASYRVRSGDTLSTIAARHRTSVASIMRANNLKKSGYIVAGQTLKIPQRGAKASPARPATGNKSVDLKSARHVVKRGDSLWIIAHRYGTTVQKIQAANGLRTSHLHVGQVLNVPGRKAAQQAPAPAPAPAAGSQKTYLVKSGDSPFRIAHAHKMPLKKFLRMNRLTASSRIYPGQALYVE